VKPSEQDRDRKIRAKRAWRAANPDKVKELQGKWDSWNAELVAPAWGPSVNKAAKKANKKGNAKKKKGV